MNWKFGAGIALVLVLGLALFATNRTNAPAPVAELPEENGGAPQAATGNVDDALDAIFGDLDAENAALAADADADVAAVTEIQSSMNEVGAAYNPNEL